MPQSHEIHWLAGLLEGEGHFDYHQRQARIRLNMTDLDVVQKARNLINPKVKISERTDPKNPHYKLQYCIDIGNNLAIQWMMTIYSLMGSRRKEEIRNVLLGWKNRKAIAKRGDKEFWGEDYGAIKALAISKKISFEEAKALLEALKNEPDGDESEQILQ